MADNVSAEIETKANFFIVMRSNLSYYSGFFLPPGKNKPHHADTEVGYQGTTSVVPISGSNQRALAPEVSWYVGSNPSLPRRAHRLPLFFSVSSVPQW